MKHSKRLKMSRITRKNKYSAPAKITAKATDEKIAERIGTWPGLKPSDIEGMYPTTDPKALAEIKKLHADIAISTDKAQRLAVIKKFAEGASAVAKKAFETGSKLALSLAVLCLLSGPALAAFTSDGFDTSMPEIIEVPVSPSTTLGFLDLKHLTDKLKFGVGYNQHKDRIWAFYFPLVWKIGPKSEAEYLYLNIGAAGNWETEKGDFMTSLSLNVNSGLAWIGNLAWPKKHLRFATLPPIELSVLGSWSPSFGFYYGGLFAYRLGGK